MPTKRFIMRACVIRYLIDYNSCSILTPRVALLAALSRIINCRITSHTTLELKVRLSPLPRNWPSILCQSHVRGLSMTVEQFGFRD